MIKYKYKCKRCSVNCSLIVENSTFDIKACPLLFVLPSWKLICKYEEIEEK